MQTVWVIQSHYDICSKSPMYHIFIYLESFRYCSYIWVDLLQCPSSLLPTHLLYYYLLCNSCISKWPPPCVDSLCNTHKHTHTYTLTQWPLLLPAWKHPQISLILYKEGSCSFIPPSFSITPQPTAIQPLIPNRTEPDLTNGLCVG